MTAYEMWDFLVATTADSKTLVSVTPQRVLIEQGYKNVVIHSGDDNSEERIIFDTDPIFTVRLQWDYISESDAGTLVNQYYSTGEGCGTARSWRWDHPTDGHDYTVRFDAPLSRMIMPAAGAALHGVEVSLRILGRST